MKRIIFMLAIAVFCLQVAGFSQNTRVGITAGASIARMTGKVDGDSKAGFMTGIVLETPIGKKFGFRPTLSYVQKGQTQPPPMGTLVDKVYMSLRYAEFNADFLYFLSGGKGGLFLGAGPSIAFNLPSKKVSITDGEKTNKTIKFGKTVTDDMRGTDFGANFTAGWRSASGFIVTLNYNKGLRNLVVEGDPGKLKNEYIGIQLGYFLNNGGAKTK
ncbi:MAG: porin family protein [Bacteroidota bacterium]|nr:porin family protein [Bacteroidota bacterium]